jgi:hypothetical protein
MVVLAPQIKAAAAATHTAAVVVGHPLLVKLRISALTVGLVAVV